MLGALRSSAARAGRHAAQQVRHSSKSTPAELKQSIAQEQKEANKWRLMTFGAIPVCLGLGILTLSNAHAHYRTAPEYPYLLIKSKDFPWGSEPLFGVPPAGPEGHGHGH